MRPSPYFWPALVQYFRERTRLWAAAGLWGGSLLLAFNLYAAIATYIPQYQVRNDFRLIYGAALNGWQNGYGHLYDLAAQKAVVEGLGWGTYWSPYLNPPTLAWIATPFLAMPFEAALFLWTLLIAGAALLAWGVVAREPQATGARGVGAEPDRDQAAAGPSGAALSTCRWPRAHVRGLAVGDGCHGGGRPGAARTGGTAALSRRACARGAVGADPAVRDRGSAGPGAAALRRAGRRRRGGRRGRVAAEEHGAGASPRDRHPGFAA